MRLLGWIGSVVAVAVSCTGIRGLAQTLAESGDREIAKMELRYHSQCAPYTYDLKEINQISNFKGDGWALGAVLAQILDSHRAQVDSINSQQRARWAMTSADQTMRWQKDMQVGKEYLVLKMNLLKDIMALFSIQGSATALNLEVDPDVTLNHRYEVSGFHFRLMQSTRKPGDWPWSYPVEVHANLDVSVRLRSKYEATQVCINHCCQSLDNQ